MLIKGYVTSVIRWVSSGILMCSMVTIDSNTTVYLKLPLAWPSLRLGLKQSFFGDIFRVLYFYGLLSFWAVSLSHCFRTGGTPHELLFLDGLPIIESRVLNICSAFENLLLLEQSLYTVSVWGKAELGTNLACPVTVDHLIYVWAGWIK